MTATKITQIRHHTAYAVPYLRIRMPERMRTESEALVIMESFAPEFPAFNFSVNTYVDDDDHVITTGVIDTRKQFAQLPNLLRRLLIMHAVIQLRITTDEDGVYLHEWDSVEFWRELALAQMYYGREN